MALTAGLLAPPISPAGATDHANQGGSQSQSQQQIPQAPQPLRVQVALVNLFATVRDSHHGIDSNLTQNDFKVFEDGQVQKIAFFRKEVDMPITLGILVDTSGSQVDLLPAEQDAASRFIHEVLRKKDMAMVISFDLDVDLLADFTEDTSILERAIRKTQINASSGGGGTPTTLPQKGPMGTDFYDAVYLACHDQLRDQAGRKALVILTDAQDEGSKLRLQDAVEAAQRADTVVHIILISEPRFYGFIGYNGASVAKKMAEETGGRVIEVHNEKSLEKAFDQISEELRLQYVLGYYPTNSAHDGAFRKIKVETMHSDLKVLTRRGYYAPKD